MECAIVVETNLFQLNGTNKACVVPKLDPAKNSTKNRGEVWSVENHTNIGYMYIFPFQFSASAFCINGTVLQQPTVSSAVYCNENKLCIMQIADYVAIPCKDGDGNTQCSSKVKTYEACIGNNLCPKYVKTKSNS